MKMRKHLFTVLMFALFVFVSASPSVLAQEEESSATMVETAKFLSNKAGIIISGPSDKEACQVNSFITKLNDNGTGYLAYFAFNLKDVDPLSIRVSNKIKLNHLYDFRISRFEQENAYFIYLETTSNEQSSKLVEAEVEDVTMNEKKEMTKTNSKKYKVDTAFIEMRDKEMSDRVVKALKHLTKLCGGKIDPF